MQRSGDIQNKHLTFLEIIFFVSLFMYAGQGKAQISTFPYVEDFETSAAWTAVSVANSDWAWGTPNHTYVIQSAGSGSKCWSAGGLSGAFYNNWEQSYVKSPVFDFTNLQYPHIKFKLFYDCEYHFDGGNLQYSLNGGTTWNDVGTVNGTTSNPIPEANDCNTQNWYNYPGITYLNNPAGFVSTKHGWCGNTQPGGTGWDPSSPGTSCVGGNGPGHWLTAEHCLTGCAGQPNVLLRFTFGSGFSCNNFDGFAFDSVAVSNGVPNSAGFTTACGAGNTVNFTSTFAACPQTNAWAWSFGDPASGASNTAVTQNASHTYSGPGTYTVVLIAKGGACNPPDTITKVVSVLGTSIATSNSVTCFGGSNGAAVATASFGAAPLSYAWSPSGGASMSASNLTAGNYSFTVTDANGCQKTATVAILQPSAINAAVSTTSLACNGLPTGSSTVTASGGIAPLSYTWLPTGGNGLNAQGLAAGSYSLIVQDANACSKTVPFNITQPPALVASGAVTNPLCSNPGSATITASGGTGALSYAWAPSGGTAGVAGNLAAGNYTATATDANGCTKQVPFVLASTSTYSTTISTVDASCFGGSNGSATATVTGSSAPYTYAWSSGGTAASESNLSAGNYVLTVTDANGCAGASSITIGQPPKLNGSAFAANISCHGLADGSATITVSGGTAPLVYNWWPSGSASTTASGLSSGNYTVDVQDANGCSKMVHFIITDPPPLSVSSAVTNALCGNPGSATVTASGGTGNLAYAWTPAGGNASTASSLPAGQYTAVVSDVNGCSIALTSTIITVPMFSTTVSSSSIACFGGSNGSASVSVNGSSAPYSYDWAPSGNTSATENNLMAGTYTTTVTDVNGCTDTKTVSVIQPAMLTLAASNATVCDGQQAVISGSASGGTAPYTYEWLPLGTSGTTLAVSPASTTAYTLNVSDQNNCSAIPLVLTVNVLPPLSITVNGPLSACSGSQASLIASAGGGNGNYQYAWQPGNLSGAQINPIVNSTVQYTVVVSDGCSTQPVQAVTQVSVSPTPVVQLHAGNLNGCPPVCTSFYDSTLIASGTVASWHWSFSNGLSSNAAVPSLCFNSPGNYTGTLSVLAVNGCTAAPVASPVIHVYPVPVADFNSDTFEGSVLNPVFNLYNTSLNADHITWETATDTAHSDAITLNYDNEGLYPVKLVAINSFGCKDSIVRYVRVDPEFTFYAPNTFTPNADARNDVFMPMGIGWKTDSYVLNVFDRWGMLIYQSRDVNKGWDGRMRGDLVEQDVYVWKVELDDIFSKHHSFAGQITVLR